MTGWSQLKSYETNHLDIFDYKSVKQNDAIISKSIICRWLQQSRFPRTQIAHKSLGFKRFFEEFTLSQRKQMIMPDIV